MLKKELVAVLGAGNMGTAIAQVVALNGYKVNLWNHQGDLEPLEQIKRDRENKKYLPGIKLSANVIPQAEMSKALEKAGLIFFVVPSCFMERVIKLSAPFIKKTAVCVDVSKGMEAKGLCLITKVLEKFLPKNKIATISGPAIAGQMAKGDFTAMNVASTDKRAMALVKKVIENKNLKLIPSADMAGVEMSGSFKNVYAIALGVCDGLNLSTNTKAVLLCEALREMGLVVQKMGGQSATVFGLAGLGDLVGTGFAQSSRNRRLGEFLGRGDSLPRALAKVGQVAEGVPAAAVLRALSKKFKIKTPLAQAVYKIIHGQISPKKAIADFLNNLR